LGLALVLTLVRVAVEVRCVPLYFNDFRVFLDEVARARDGGPLYATSRPDYFNPGAPVYKYPPPFAALLKPVTAWPRERAVALFLAASLFVLAAAFVVMLAIFEPRFERGLLVLLLYLNWEPSFESLQGLQLEPLLLLLLTLALACLVSGRPFGAGLALGVACAFKVYPGLLVLPYLARRRWTLVAGAALGVTATLALAGLALPARLCLQYFTEILPQLGGIAPAWDNIGLLAHAGRLGLLLLAGSRQALAAARSISTTLDLVNVPGLGTLTLAASTLVGGPLAVSAAKAFARARELPPRIGEPAALGLGVCAVLLLLPTSWPDYQTLLALPVVWAGLTVSREEKGLIALLAATVAIAALPAQARFLDENRGLICSLRSLLPLLLGALCRARLLAARPAQGTIEALTSSS
jgi:hypothetical protein